MTTKVSYLQNQSTPASQDREVIAALLGASSIADVATTDVSRTTPGHGVVNDSDLVVVHDTGMTVTVYAGTAFVRGTSVAGQGVYHVQLTENESVILDAADPSNPRKDLIVVRVYDSSVSGPVDGSEITVLKGTPAASPEDPTIPESTLVLARVLVGAGVTTVSGQITDLRHKVAALGGLVRCTSSTRPNGLSYGLDSESMEPYVRIYETDTGRVLQSTGGTSWLVISEPLQMLSLSYSGLTLGDGSSTAWFQRLRERCYGWLKIELGSTSSIASDIIVTLPNGYYIDAPDNSIIGHGHAISGSTYAILVAQKVSSSTFVIKYSAPQTTYNSHVPVTSAMPVTAAAGVSYCLHLQYDAGSVGV